ncbi:MAG: indole-3-glycerol phosphate synthase TrpC [Spirochaetaceae bacterium]|jgi:indole-3-glycerol phosphate synthase|nr:indole-3-glycerol phosphate synthase TrpC [Spirochaetaceae bacterium]
MILDDIAAAARRRVRAAKETISAGAMRSRAESIAGSEAASGAAAGAAASQALPEIAAAEAVSGAALEIPLSFEAALAGAFPGASAEGAGASGGPAFICEVKRASPSKGLIVPGSGEFPCRAIAQEYEAAGAQAISVLTEPDYFLGNDGYLREIAAAVKIPVLRKDFIIDEYQICEAKTLGAQAVLLICALLDQPTLASFLALARSLSLAVLTEVHDRTELERALACGARIIGINNRDLKTFTVDLAVTERLRPLVPPGHITVSESGVRTRDDVQRLRDCGVDALLVGESLMRAAGRGAFLRELRRA